MKINLKINNLLQGYKNKIIKKITMIKIIKI